jgi:hypothetical protein
VALRRRLFCRGVVTSDEGFSVWPSMHGSTWYRERNRKVEWHSDLLIDETLDIGLPPDAGWITRSGKEPFAPGDHERIVRNVRRALEFAGWTVAKGCLQLPDSVPVTSQAGVFRSSHPA